MGFSSLNKPEKQSIVIKKIQIHRKFHIEILKFADVKYVQA